MLQKHFPDSAYNSNKSRAKSRAIKSRAKLVNHKKLLLRTLTLKISSSAHQKFQSVNPIKHLKFHQI